MVSVGNFPYTPSGHMVSFFLTGVDGGSNGAMAESNHHESHSYQGTHVRWTRGVNFLSIFVVLQHFLGMTAKVPVNPHTKMRGPRRPHKNLKAAQTIIIGIIFLPLLTP